ncbi:hypothetical protein [Amycolatopsis magusensis]|uniref:DUF222 domain-containing protein n=1 Tax=Amycolatopsis magusensis TaxID=882444 RepID=A0ABS4PU63_9PSEU|nr:hypothetical protein [Amycolatopsis magusensis]MBP2182973.1 hypothetical protein [Amycolatopsis magusensis]
MTDPHDVSVQVHDAMKAWRHVARLPTTDSDRPRTASPVLDKALAELAHAECAATQAGRIDAAGLAHAQRILRELFT